MNGLLKKITYSLLIFTAFVETIGIVLLYFFPKTIPSAIPWLVVLFMATTWFVCYGALKAGNKNFLIFSNRYLLLTMVKMILYLALVALALYTHPKPVAIPFVLTVLVLFFVYLVFESYWIQRIRNTLSANKSAGDVK